MSGALQASVIALIGGYLLRGVPPQAAVARWPYFAFGYAFLAATVPWIAGGYLREELRWRASLLYGVVLAFPMALAARWLRPTPYRTLGYGCGVMVVLWAGHLAVSVVAQARSRAEAPAATEEFLQ